MSKRKLTIAQQMELDNILDFLPEYCHGESVAYLQSIYGIENEAEYLGVDKYEYLDLFHKDEIVDYFGNDLLSEYEDDVLLSWIDKDWLYRNVDLDKVVDNHKAKDVLDCLSESDIVEYLKLRGYELK